MRPFIYFILVTVFFFASCENFDELALDPNRPTTAPASLILNNVLNDLYDINRPWSLEHRWNQYWCCNYNYYGDNEYRWTTGDFRYFSMKNIAKMEEEALKTGVDEVNGYSAVGKFLKAFFLYDMTMRFGDIPASEAVLGAENIFPKYDSQKEVFQMILTLLDEANDDLGKLLLENTTQIDGDIYFGGSLEKYQKAVNSFKLRVLLQLSKKEGDAELNVKQRFTEVMNNPVKYPIFESAEDNFEFTYIANINNYPTNPGNRGFDSRRYNMSATYLNTLASLKDPRTFIVADPTEAGIAAGLSPTDFSAYLGAPSGEDLSIMTFRMGNGEYSAIKQDRYYGSFGGPEPGVILSYHETVFNIAEAINRGWIGGNAEEFYTKGITASLEFYDISSTDIQAYLAQTEIAYKGNNAEGLNQIMQQRYLSLFQQSGREAYYHWRRTGFPTFDVGVGTGNGGVIPYRYQYPASEPTANKANYEAALTSQFGGEDNVNAKMWLIE
ncbi:MAG: SusD/RagB family nutrient-binding outer membrane lipoprotein [Bacteroidia bacterium]|nr:SusD/RagB family nutrient-binding outer membrane lipoprotein [Bacteroidia bacterium]